MNRTRSIILSAAFVVAIAFCAQVASAQQNTPSPKTRMIEVSGNGEVQAAPDLATLSVAIETHASTAAEAARQNAALAQKVVTALKDKLGSKGKIWTGGYTLFPEYSEPMSSGKPTIAGYRAQNSITVETSAFDTLGPAIDAAIAAGANRINSLDFGLRDDTKARSEAITNAAKDAQAQAQALASALGVKLGPVLKATTVAQVRPLPVRPMMMMMAKAPSVPTPVTPSEVTVPATVSLTYEIQ